jgi:septum formation protein
MPAGLVLASTSRYRASLLERLGLPFRTEPPGVEETALAGETPEATALRLALAKAESVANRFPDAWVLGSDQVADCAGTRLAKPGDAARARAQLRASSGRAVVFHTAVALRHAARQIAVSHVDRTTVHFRRLDEAAIDAYVRRDQPFDCAGGFRVEGLGAALFDSIESSDPTALVGLPLIWVAAALRNAGLDPLTARQP